LNKDVKALLQEDFADKHLEMVMELYKRAVAEEKVRVEHMAR